VLHNGAFFGVGARGVCKGFVGLGSSKHTTSDLGLCGIRISCAHLTNEVLKSGANIPIPLGRGFVEGDAPSDGVTADQLLGHFTLCRQVELGADDDDRYRLMEEKSGSGGEREGRSSREDEEMMRCSQVSEVRVTLTRSSPLMWYIRCRRSSISRRLVSWVRL
jgi:hypothetical protein